MFALYVIFFWLFVGTICWILFYFRTGSRMTSETEGAVVSATEREIVGTDSRREETTIVCRFKTQGKEFEISQTLRGRVAKYYAPGRTLPLVYNPANPNMARLKQASR